MGALLKYWVVFLLLAAFGLAGADVFAQTWHFIRGVVKDSSTGQPLVGVSVSVEGTRYGAVTDGNGLFRVNLPSAGTYSIVFSHIGYEKELRRVTTDNSRLVYVGMKMDVRALSPMVVTGTRTPKLLKDAPVVTRLIGEDDIRTLDLPDVQDVLQAELPGIEFSYSMNQQVGLNMSGFGGKSVLFLVDGERLAGETLDNVDYSRLNMDNVSRIEIVKGAASSLYGSNAVGGVVNIISRENDDKWSCQANLRYGTHNDRRFGGSLGFRAGAFNNMANLQYAACDAIQLANAGDYSQIYANHSLNVKERMTYTMKKMKLTGRAGYFFRAREAESYATERYRDYTGGLKANWSPDSANDLELAYSFDQYDKSDYTLKEGLDIRDYSNVQHSLRTIFNRTFRGKHILTAGGDYLYDYLMSYQFAQDGAHLQHTADGFLQFDWNPTRRFNMVSALRYDNYSEADVRHLSPKLALMYKWGDFALRASYADGFRAPTLKEMYMQFDMASIFTIYGNPGLKAETSRNFSMAGEFTRGSYNVTVTAFYNHVANRITTAWNRALEGMQYVNMSPLWISGTDANFFAKWKNGLGTKLSYVFTHEQIPKGEPEFSATRPHSATAQLTYAKKWAHYGFNVALSGRFLSAVTCDEYLSLTNFEETKKVTYPGYSIWKLTFGQHFRKAFHLTLSVDNLFNYVPEYYYSNSPFTTGTTCSVALSVDFGKIGKNK